MAYAAVISLANTIDRTLNSNLYSISLDEIQQIISLHEYVTPFQTFLEKFPDKFCSLEDRMREVVNEAEDIIESLVLEKIFVSCEDESLSHPSTNLEKMIKEIRSKSEKLMKEYRHDFPDEEAKAYFESRITDLAYEAEDANRFFKWQKTHTCYREKWRFLPPEFAKFKSKHYLNKISSEIDSIMEEVMAIKGLVGSHDDDDGGDGDGDGHQGYGWFKCHRSAKHELRLKKVIEEITFIDAQVKEIKESLSSKGLRRSTGSLALRSSSTAPPIQRDRMVGFEDYVLDLKDRLCGGSSKRQVIPICGMGGIGKTTLARNVYDDPLVVENFVIRIWVTITQHYSVEGIFSSIMEFLKNFDNEEKELEKNKLFEMKELKKVPDDEKVHKILTGRRYLVVMDDIWSTDAWDVVWRVLPDDSNGSRIVLTTRLSDVASYADPSSKLYEMGLLNADQSWNLFKEKVFVNQLCPRELEDVGKHIAEGCKGLPLAIVVIAGLVSTVSRDLASWMEIAENVKSAETAEHDQIEEILSLSYVQLPQYLRPCFLYMGSFAEDDEIHVSRLIRLWIAEGFVNSPTGSESFEEVAEKLFEELVKRNLVLVTKRKSDGRIKSCSLHDLMRDLCIRKAHESKFFLNVMDRHIEKEHFIESIRNQHRVNVDSSYLSYLSHCDGSTIHSIKCSKNHLVELDFVEGVRLVRVLDVEGADVESLPDKLFDLFHLRYLGISSWCSIPRILSNLRNLQTLIIHGEKQFILGVGGARGIWLPWCLPQLRHVYFHGELLFDDPKDVSCSLENLQTLSYIDSMCCTEQILKKIPNLRQLKIDCSYREDEVCLNDWVHLQQLESLAVRAGHHALQSQPKYYDFTFPKMLKKLSLRDLELSWNDMIVAGSLPNLRVLKLRGCTCAGGTWETTEGAFPVLEILVIEASVLEHWITETSHFPRLRRLLLHSCRHLHEIPNDIGEIATLELLEVQGDAKESLVESLEQIQTEQEELENNTLRVLYIAPVEDPRSGAEEKYPRDFDLLF